jgi:hypothetical protein
MSFSISHVRVGTARCAPTDMKYVYKGASMRPYSIYLSSTYYLGIIDNDASRRFPLSLFKNVIHTLI